MAHPQQGLVQANDLPVGTWYVLDIDKPYPEGNIYYYCSKCGLKNRMDEDWRYCRDPLHAAQISAAAAAFDLMGVRLGPNPGPSVLGGSLSVNNPLYAPPCLLKYECADCRGDDKRHKPHDEEPSEEEEEEDDEEEEDHKEDKEEEEEGKPDKQVGAAC